MPIELYIISLCFAALGAILGFLSFVNQYLVKFKPKIFVNNYLNIKYEAKNNYYLVDFIELNISISNSKNTYGTVEDLSLGIYQTNQVSPKYQYIFPLEISINEEKYKPFSPIILPPKTFKTVFVKFGLRDLDRCIINDLNISFDLFSKFQNRKKWKLLKKISMYNYKSIKKEDEKFILLNYEIEREALKKWKLNPKSNYYNGNIGRWLISLKYKMIIKIKKPFKLLINIVSTFIIILKQLNSNLIGKIFFESIIFKKSSDAKRVNVSILKPDDYTINSLDKISKIIEKKSKHKDIKDKIEYKYKNNIINISRNGYQLEICAQGDSSIISKGGNSTNTNQINFEFKYKKNILGYKYWTENNKIITKYRICLKLLDYFCMFSVKH